MLQKLIARRHKGQEEGFTLIELMVVVLIIAILIAIAIPTFLGARQRANNRAAQSSLRNALTAAKTLFTDNNDYTAAGATAVGGVEPSLTFVDNATPSTGPKTVSVKAKSATEWIAAVWSSSSNCYYIRDRSNGPGTSFGGALNLANSNNCTADAADTAAVAGSSFP
jgi:type IV pilus assembly protein PilA